jgi:hypothetical protein
VIILEHKAKSRKWLCCFIVILLSAIVCVPLFLSTQFKLVPTDSAKSVMETNADQSVNSSLISTPNQNITAPIPAILDNGSSTISKEEAINIAMPLINQYITENNSTLTGIHSIFWGNFHNWGQPVVPHYEIYATFDANSYPMNDSRHCCTGYDIYVNAVNGTVDFEQPFMVM